MTDDFKQNMHLMNKKARLLRVGLFRKQHAALCAELFHFFQEQFLFAVVILGKTAQAHELDRAAIDHLLVQTDLVAGELARASHALRHITYR